MNIIVGRSGTGKTKLCMNQIKDEILKACNKPLIYIVPEQFTFEAEKELIEILRKSQKKAEKNRFRELILYNRRK